MKKYRFLVYLLVVCCVLGQEIKQKLEQLGEHSDKVPNSSSNQIRMKKHKKHKLKTQRMKREYFFMKDCQMKQRIPESGKLTLTNIDFGLNGVRKFFIPVEFVSIESGEFCRDVQLAGCQQLNQMEGLQLIQLNQDDSQRFEYNLVFYVKFLYKWKKHTCVANLYSMEDIYQNDQLFMYNANPSISIKDEFTETAEKITGDQVTPAKLANMDEIDFEGIIAQLEGFKLRLRKLKHKHKHKQEGSEVQHHIKFDRSDIDQKNLENDDQVKLLKLQEHKEEREAKEDQIKEIKQEQKLKAKRERIQVDNTSKDEKHKKHNHQQTKVSKKEHKKNLNGLQKMNKRMSTVQDYDSVKNSFMNLRKQLMSQFGDQYEVISPAVDELQMAIDSFDPNSLVSSAPAEPEGRNAMSERGQSMLGSIGGALRSAVSRAQDPFGFFSDNSQDSGQKDKQEVDSDVASLQLQLNEANQKIDFLEDQVKSQIKKMEEQMPTDGSSGLDTAKFKELYFKLSQDHMNNNIDSANELCAQQFSSFSHDPFLFEDAYLVDTDSFIAQYLFKFTGSKKYYKEADKDFYSQLGSLLERNKKMHKKINHKETKEMVKKNLKRRVKSQFYRQPGSYNLSGSSTSKFSSYSRHTSNSQSSEHSTGELTRSQSNDDYISSGMQNRYSFKVNLKGQVPDILSDGDFKKSVAKLSKDILCEGNQYLIQNLRNN